MKKTIFLGLKKPDADEYFDIEDFNGNSDIIDEALKKVNSFTQIGDARITTREIEDPNWLLCPNTDVNEDNYPDLYYILASKADIYKGEWAAATEINNPSAAAPMYGIDSEGNECLYFISGKTVYKCHTDFTNWSSYERPSAVKVQYVNGVWVMVSAATGALYYSSDCFETDTHQINFTTSDDENIGSGNSTNSVIRFTGNTWQIVVERAGEYNPNSVYISATDDIESEYTYLERVSVTEYVSDKVIFKNGACIFVISKWLSQPGYQYQTSYIYYNSNGAIDIDESIHISSLAERSSTGEFKLLLKYIPDIDAVLYNDSILIKNDATQNDLGITSISSYAYFKGFLYIKSDSSIYRYDCNSFESEPVVKTEYVTGEISASSQRLYMANGTDSIYYIENENSVSIPEALPGTIFKTYIRAK